MQPLRQRFARVAQWLEPAAHNGLVGGSSPSSRTKKPMKNLILSISILLLCGCTSTSGYSLTEEGFNKLNTSYQVNATWYQSGSRTANGEKFNPDGMTAAHKKLPFNTRVRLTNLENGKSIVVRINDRGPFRKGYEFDLARGAARAINMRGISKLEVLVLD